MELEWKNFKRALFNCIVDIDKQHFIITTFGRDQQDYRERVYCYELYHQLRTRLGDNYPYELFGEHNKSGILEICLEFGDKIAPDFIVHEPGAENNFVVIEVKSVEGIHEHSGENVIKDIRKLNCFLNKGYRHAILLVYGYFDPTKVKEYLTKLFADNNLDTYKINILLNYKVGELIVM